MVMKEGKEKYVLMFMSDVCHGYPSFFRLCFSFFPLVLNCFKNSWIYLVGNISKRVWFCFFKKQKFLFSICNHFDLFIGNRSSFSYSL